MAFLLPLLAPLVGKLIGGGESGIRNVRKTGLYALHKGEVVVKAKDAKKIPKAVKMKQLKNPQPTKITKAMIKNTIAKAKNKK
jgi:hypothetical protein